jgi:replication factor A1
MFKEYKCLTPRIGTYNEQRRQPWGKSNPYRGRPKGKKRAYFAYLQSVAAIACKHDLDPERLADAFFDAVEEEIAYCGNLTIRCRAIHHDTATFLIERDEKVVWQFPVDLESIRNPNVRAHLKKIPITHNRQNSYSKNPKISGLRFGMKKINVIGRVTHKPPTRHVNTRWGSTASVSNVTIADDTGSIRLSLWNDQIDAVQINDAVELKNCYVGRFAGESQVRIGRKGTLAVVNQPQHEESIQYSALAS